jgi:GWxTD domain-containing protein
MKAIYVTILCAICSTLAGQTQSETSAKPMTAAAKKKQEARQREELKSAYSKWRDEDVAYILTTEERAAFNRLQNDEEREQFVEQFWRRRDPTPDSEENEFKEEHYRRIAYANEHFASGIPGWRTDRGHIYIVFGAPDQREDHSSGGFYNRPATEGGGTTSTFPFEVWRYRHMEGIGEDISLEFVDTTMSGEYHLTIDASEKDALLYVPGAGLTQAEQMGLSTKAARFNRTDGTHNADPIGGQPESMNEFNRIDLYAKVFAAPAPRFPDLETAFVTTGIRYNVLPFKVQVAYFPVTDASVLTYITVQFDNKDLQFQAKDGVQKAIVNILGSVTTLTHRPVGRFEDTVTVDSPEAMMDAAMQRKSIYNKCLPLAPGSYRLNLVAKDTVGGNLETYQVALMVPRPDVDKLQLSSLVLADVMEGVSVRSTGGGQFVIGDSKIRPRVDAVFHRDEKLGVYCKAYHFEGDGQKHAPSATAEYEVTKEGSAAKVLEAVDDLSKVPGAAASQVTLEKFFDLRELTPGRYTLKLKITDKVRGNTITQTAAFSVI